MQFLRKQRVGIDNENDESLNTELITDISSIEGKVSSIYAHYVSTK